MPVNMDPAKKHRRTSPPDVAAPAATEDKTKQVTQGRFGEETEEDKIKALADAESKNLWDATEVIDMDKF